MAENLQSTTLGGGCFWCIEAVFTRVKGVKKVTSGYAGGKRPDPTYEQVCSGATGHAEVIRILFDPEIITFAQLLEILFAIHDPTTPNRQGADTGTQYRSVIFAESQAQEESARAIVAQLEASGTFNDPIVTEIGRLETFYPAEAYHQNYYDSHPYQGYCQVVISPKIEKLNHYFKQYLA